MTDLRYLNLDLDGVFPDFYNAARRILGRPYMEMTGAEAWGVLDKVPHLFRDLPPLADAMELWQGIQAFAAREGNVSPRVLSALPKLTNELRTAPGDKREWVRQNLSPTMPVLLVDGGLAKSHFARPGDILIDDLERNIRAWRAAGGLGVLHTDAKSSLQQLEDLARHARIPVNLCSSSTAAAALLML